MDVKNATRDELIAYLESWNPGDISVTTTKQMMNYGRP